MLLTHRRRIIRLIIRQEIKEFCRSLQKNSLSGRHAGGGRLHYQEQEGD